VYFTSGTQEGTPIDRMLGAIARTFGVTGSVAAAPAGRGKAYFIERLLRNVVFQESGLAGINRRLQLRMFALQAAAYIACAAILVFGLIGLGVSYRANASYIESVDASAKDLDATRLGASASTLPLDALLPRLDALKAVADSANQHAADVPWRMRLGLYRGKALGESAHDAWLRELNRLLVPALAARFGEQVRSSVATPDRLYEYLKGYLMFGDPGHRDVDHLRALAAIELQRMYPNDDTSRQRLVAHFEPLLASKDAMSSVPTDANLVQQARYALRTASLPVLMYSRLKLAYAGDTKRALRLDVAAGPGADQVLVRQSGAALSEPVPAIYSREVFREVNGVGKLDLIKQFAADGWVFGDSLFDIRNAGVVVTEMMALYEQDYIRAWDGILQDVRVKPTADSRELVTVLGILSSPASPLKGLLGEVAENTDLKPPPPPAGGTANPVQAAGAALAAGASQLANVLGAPPPGSAEPGAAVTAHFLPIRTLVQGPPGAAPIDGLLASLRQTHQQMQSMGSGLGDTGALDALVRSGQADALQGLQQLAAQLPAPIGSMVAQIGTRTESIATGAARGELSGRYGEQVLRTCRELIDGRYPFNRGSSTDVPLADFGRVFGYGGTFETFFKENLAPLVDASRSPWRWREGAAQIGGSAALLRQFQQAQRIREAYFKPGTQQPEARFNLTADSLDAAATRFTLDLDGQRFEYRHGPTQSLAMTWPGGSVGQAAIAFEQKTGVGPSSVQQGPWAWFRMLDKAQVQRDSDTRLRISFTAGDRSMRAVLDAASIRNPFIRDELAGFRCAM
jgi:type VI secretion system protein ImpL